MATSLLAVGLVVSVTSWGLSLVVQRVGQHRFDEEVRNAALAGVATARTALVTPWKMGDYPALRRALEGVAREQHVVAVAACRTDFSELASTRDYPGTFSLPSDCSASSWPFRLFSLAEGACRSFAELSDIQRSVRM
jgi:hypothetical protein